MTRGARSILLEAQRSVWTPASPSWAVDLADRIDETCQVFASGDAGAEHHGRRARALVLSALERESHRLRGVHTCPSHARERADQLLALLGRICDLDSSQRRVDVEVDALWRDLGGSG